MRVFKSISSFAVLALMGLMLSSGAFAGGGNVTGVSDVLNAQFNYGYHDADVVAWGVNQTAGGDATISASAIGNSFSIEVESTSCLCPTRVSNVWNLQANLGSHDANLDAFAVHQYAGDDAVMAASAVGNTASIYIGPLDP